MPILKISLKCIIFKTVSEFGLLSSEAFFFYHHP
nr:MAG TPA: hypothetical protein [Caudoviricetes sp.]